MQEVAEAAKVITGSADDDSRVILGANISDSLTDEVAITVVATGFEKADASSPLYGTSVVPAAGTWVPPVSKVSDRTMRPNVRVREEQPVTAMNKRVSASDSDARRAVPSESVMGQAEPSPSVEEAAEDTIDIPAFIRKKMM